MDTRATRRPGPHGLRRGLNAYAAPRLVLAGLLLACLAPAATGAPASTPAEPIGIHPDNPKYFLFRGKPLVLITATEHYGSVINRPFDYERYLLDAADKKQTLTRTFLLFRELQTARNPYSPCKPESPDYITPWARVGPDKALDGEPKVDLDQWNPEFFQRLDKFLARASQLGVVVELTLFSNTYNDTIWKLNPLKVENNLQGVGAIEWFQYTSMKDPAVFQRQLAYARKVVRETAKYDNLYYEVCNEPGGDWPGGPTVAEVDAWQAEVAKVIREELKNLGRTHLVAGSPTHAIRPVVKQPFDEVLKDGGTFEVVNFHSHPDNYLGEKRYDLGGFMAKDLVLETLAEFCRGMRDVGRKPYVFDEDNAASAYKDEQAWTIARKRAWVTVMHQGHYDIIDFSVTVGNEAGTEQSSRMLRSWMRNLSEFIHSFDFVHAEPQPDWLAGKPAGVFAVALAKEGEDYVAYLADARELKDEGAGGAITGPVSFRLPAGRYAARFYSPAAGQYSPGVVVTGGEAAVELHTPEFRQDLVLRVARLP